MKTKRIFSALLLLCLLAALLPLGVHVQAAEQLEAPVVSASNVASSGEIKLTWEAVDGAASYRVYRATSKSGSYSRVTTTQSTAYTNSSANPGEKYFYYVVAVSSGGTLSAKSNIVNRTCDLPRPELTVSNVDSTGKIKISWKAIENAASYELYRSTDNANWSLLKSTTATSVTNTSVEAGKTYYYKAKAIAANSAANSAFSTVKSAACDLSQPVLTLSNVAASGKIKISWTAVKGAVSYKLYRSTDNTNWSLLKNTEETSYVHTAAVAGTRYYYKVRAVASDSASNSAYSAVKNRVCDLPRPVVTLSNVASTGKVKISWEAVDGAVKYEVYRSTDNANFTLLKTTTATSMTNTSTEAGKCYYYKVKAIASDTNANSAFSSVKSRTCDLPQPTITLSNDPATGKVKISWNAVEGAVKYELSRSADQETWTVMKSVTGTSTINSNGVAGMVYYYRVRAIASNSAANSAYSPAKYRTCDLAQPVITLSNDPATGKVKISWEAVEGAVKYEVYRSTDNQTFTRLKTLTGTEMINANGVAGTQYYYKVRALALDSAANSAYSASKYRTCDLAQPVITLSNDAATGKVKISWEAVEGAVKYELSRSTDQKTWTVMKSVTGTSTINSNGVAGTKYYYRVRAIASPTAANSAYSAVKYRTCDLERPVAEFTVKADSATFTWAPVEKAVSYEVYRAETKDGTYKKLATAYGTKYQDDGLTPETTYFYKIRAIASPTAANSAYTAIMTVKTLAPAKPDVTVFMDSDTVKNATITVIFVTNHGTENVRFFAAGGQWIDADYTNFDRSIVLYDYAAFEAGSLLQTSYVDVAPGQTVRLLIGVNTATWYDENTTIRLDMYYDGITYTTYSSSSGGFRYTEK